MTGRTAEALIVAGVLLLLAALVGCAHSVQQSRVAPGCVVDPPLFPPDPDDATDDERDEAVRYGHRVWLGCASMRAADYPVPPLYEEAGPGEESDED